MPQTRKNIVAWVGSHILPHEADVRRWLRRSVSRSSDVDDVIQEAYCRITALDTTEHIDSARAYFFQTARNVALEHLRRAQVVRIDSITDIDLLSLVDETPSPERVLNGTRQLQLVQSLIEGLPQRCREVFVLRRVHGLPQKEIATRLGISESTVEMHVSRGLRVIMKALETDPPRPDNEVTGADDDRCEHRPRGR